MRAHEFIVESISNKLDDSSYYDQVLAAWSDYYSDQRRAKNKLDYYKNEVDDLIQNGGNIYRVIFADAASDIHPPYGKHWTVSSDYIEDYIDNLAQHYSDGREPYVVIATVPPNSISNGRVDLESNPTECEVNLNSTSGVKFKIHKLDKYGKMI